MNIFGEEESSFIPDRGIEVVLAEISFAFPPLCYPEFSEFSGRPVNLRQKWEPARQLGARGETWAGGHVTCKQVQLSQRKARGASPSPL